MVMQKGALFEKLDVNGGGGGGGSADYSKTVQRATTLPTADASNAGQQFLYSGATNATYTHGYIYENQHTPSYTGTVSFDPASLSGTTVACSGDDFAAFLTEAGADPTPIVSGTMTYEADANGWRLVGKDSNGDTVTTFLEYVEDYEDFGFTFTGTPEDGDVVDFTCSIEEAAGSYNWVRIDVQPAGSVDYNRVVEKTATELPTPSAELAGKAYMYVGESNYGAELFNGVIYECTMGSSKPSATIEATGDLTVNMWDINEFVNQTGFSNKDTDAVFTYVEETAEMCNPTEDQLWASGGWWSIPDPQGFMTAMHGEFPNVDFFDPLTPVYMICFKYESGACNLYLFDESWNVISSSSNVDPTSFGIVIDGTPVNGDEVNTQPTVGTDSYWLYLGDRVDINWGWGLSIDGTPVNGDTITVHYIAPHAAYVWKPTDHRYFNIPYVHSGADIDLMLIQYIGWDTNKYKKGHFYRPEPYVHDPSVTIEQTSGTALEYLEIGDSYRFSDQMWEYGYSKDAEVRFVYTGQAVLDGTVTYDLSEGFEATLSMSDFYSAMVSHDFWINTTCTYRLIYEGSSWNVHQIYEDGWDEVKQYGVDPAAWGLTITTGTPQDGDKVDFVITTIPGDTWEEYIDGTLYKSKPAGDWGIYYGPTPSVGTELLATYIGGFTSYTWVEKDVQSPIRNEVGLAAIGWNNNEYDIQLPGAPEDFESRVVLVSPNPDRDNTAEYVAAGILCVEQSWGGNLKFTCTTTPLVDILVNVVIL